MKNCSRLFALLFVLCMPILCLPYDLSQARVEKLPNGLTVMLLEDHYQPLVSTQVLYKVGARNECVGATGLAHFVEHMAFRATKNFPDTEVVGRIYAMGGEWHGYTWIDQTTYFETVPSANLDVVLRIQSDRMANVVNKLEEVEAERGAVLTELHSYENDPASILFDAVNSATFLQHPYRYNTIGWTSDVEKITHADLVDFYSRFYNPSNAILAIAGDFDQEKVLTQVREYFGALSAKKVESAPRTLEPAQTGERRVTVTGAASLNYFQINYRAPAARDRDFPAFLLLQGVLGGSGGVNFRQSGFSNSVKPGTRLHGSKYRLTTFFTPTFDPYIFNIAGRVEPSRDRKEVEEEIESRIKKLREEGVPDQELTAARGHLLRELVFDVETPEDAAHQMAYFQGIEAFPVLVQLPSLLKSVTAEDIQQVARKYLHPEAKTTGWYIGGKVDVQTPRVLPLELKQQEETQRPASGTADAACCPPVTRTLKNGIALVVRKISRTPTAHLRLLLPTNTVEAQNDFSKDDPVWRHSSIHWRVVKGELQNTFKIAAESLVKLQPASADTSAMENPEYRLNLAMREVLGITPSEGKRIPRAIAVVGDIEPRETLRLLTREFGRLKKPEIPSSPALKVLEKEKVVRLPGKAQSQLGYAVPAPPPKTKEAGAYRTLLYILTHGYEGRLGKELIGNKGLIYYIGSNYHSDGVRSWIEMSAGVNPDKLEVTRGEFERLMNDLQNHLPTEAELAEAKQHLIGRRITAYQSNEELTAYYVREWIEQGRLMSQEEFERQIRSVTLKQLHAIIPVFLSGALVVVDTR